MAVLIEADFDPSEHGPALLELMTQYAEEITGEADPLAPAVKRDLVGELAKRPTIRVLLAFADSDPAGFAIVIDSFSTFACRPISNLHDIFVAPAFRERGVARALLGEVEALAKRDGCCKVTLEVLENNAKALALYHRCGFSPHAQDPALGRGLFYEKRLD